MELLIKALNEEASKMYSNHGHFHNGDAGLDLYVLEDITFNPGETKYPVSLKMEKLITYSLDLAYLRPP